MFEIGTKVEITKGQCKGETGTVSAVYGKRCYVTGVSDRRGNLTFLPGSLKKG